MKWLLAVASLVLVVCAPPVARPWLGALTVIGVLALWLKRPPDPSESEALRRSLLEEESLRSDRLLAQLQRADSAQASAALIVEAIQGALKVDACALMLEGKLMAGRENAPAWTLGLRRLQQRECEVAVPLESGVLWLKRQKPPLAAHELNLLERLAGPAALSLGLWRRQEALQNWLSWLLTLIEGARSLIGTQDPRRVGDQLQALARTVVPHHSGFIVGLGVQPTLERVWPAAPEPRLDALPRSPVARFVSRDLMPGLTHWLSAPLAFEGGASGLLLLGNPEETAFSPEQEGLLAMIATLGAGALAQTHLYADLALTHQELRESQERLLQSSKLAAVGQLAAGMAHELNSPLAAISLSLESAQRKPEAATRRLEPARVAIEQCQHVVNSLLLYTRDQPMQMLELEVQEVVAETLLLTRGQFQQDGLQLEVELGPAARVLGNPGQLRQVLTNLLVNARDALLLPGASGRRARVSTSCSADKVCLCVEDEGPGMNADILARALEPFFTTKPVGRGTGLGLSVSHEIVRQHGGELHLSSQPGHGTRVEVELPRR